MYNPKVTTLTLTPETNDALLDIIYESSGLFDAVVIEAFGLGNVPSNNKLKSLIEAKTKQGSLRLSQGIYSFITTQCRQGSVGSSYSSSASYFGAILCADMTLPAVVCKASLVLG